MVKENRSHQPDLLDDSFCVNLTEFCRICRVESTIVIDMIEYDIIQPEGVKQKEWRFTGLAIKRFLKAQRLKNDLELNLPGLALSLELLDEIEKLQIELAKMR